MSSKECMKRLRDYRRNHNLCMVCGGERESEEYVTCKPCRARANNRCIRLNLSLDQSSFNKFMASKAVAVGSFGLALHLHMVENEVSPYMLARAICVSNRSIDRWLYESAIPKSERQSQLARFFGCTLEKLGLE